MKKLFSNLTVQVLFAITIGVLTGSFFPEFSGIAKMISQAFINMISMLIAPIIFLTIVLGIGHMGDMKKVGRVGGKALLYFEIVSTLAIVIGMVVANLLKPGLGVQAAAGDISKVETYAKQAEGINWLEFFFHIIPNNIVASFAEGNILQILFFAILFGYGLNKMGADGAPVLRGMDKLSKVFFNIMKVVMRLAPLGAFGGMAFSVGTYGLHALLPMAKLMGSVYLTCILFIFVILNGICRWYKFSLWSYLKFIRQEILIVFGTSSSESVLPSMMQKMEAIGCDKSVVGLVIPTGYSFNLDGTAIYLSMAVIFLTQVFGISLSVGQQLTVLAILMVTSKGAAGVTGSGFIVLASTLTALKIMPVEHIAILLGVDRFMSEARAITNMIGNGIATIVIAKSEKQFDEEKYRLAIRPASKSLPYSLLLIPFLALSITTKAQVAQHTFELGSDAFLLDGKPLQMISGEMHCARIPVAYWRDRMKMAKAMGLNTIGTYVFWNAHEAVQGKYDFSGNNNIAEFVKIAQEEGLWVVLRPSPYACAEWEFGGYPWWLLKDSSLKVRSKDPRFIDAYTKYIGHLAKQLVPLQVTHGGNILMVQIENEYGSYSDDQSYMDLNRKIFRDAGFDGILFTCDGADQMPKGYLPGYLPAVNGLEDPAAVKALINKYHDGKGPYYIAEWYPGWFDHWGEKHAKVSADQSAKRLDSILAAGISINMYMFHGGTTRDFMNGANMNVHEPYAPQVSSYDYDAPLDEAGNSTEKFMKFRAIIQKHLPKGTVLPPVPAKKKSIAISNIQLKWSSSIFTNLPKSQVSKDPRAFEDLDQAYGFILYRTRISDVGLLKVAELRDYATVYLNGKRVGVLDRRTNTDSLLLAAVPKNAVLDILVENNGRINYGPYLADNRHGITKEVSLNGKPVQDWENFRLPFTKVSDSKYTFAAFNHVQPALYKGTFNVDTVADTYLDMRSFGKGFVFLNGHNLGKYWNIGPQQTIYVPAVWLKKGNNEIVVFDQLKSGHTSIASIDHPILDQLQK